MNILLFPVIFLNVILVDKVNSLLRKKRDDDNSQWNTFLVPKPRAKPADDDNSQWNTFVIPKPRATPATEKFDLLKINSDAYAYDDKGDDPCDKYNPVKPDFRKNSKRISEIKCYEYIWQMKVRVDQAERVKRCQRKLKLSQSLVVGGHKTFLGEYPHMVAIGWPGVDEPWIFKCGGTLISESFVLTAAHCTNAPPDTRLADTEPKLARIGDKNLVFYLQNIPIKRIIKHPRYAPPKKYFDIALFELETAAKFSKTAQPACLWGLDDLTSLGPKATVSGWGVTRERGNEGSAELLAATVDLIDSQSCDNYLRPFHNRNWNGLAYNQVCAGQLTGGIDVCQGDSGGPLQVKIDLPITSEGFMHYVIGVTSFGIGCARVDTPGVYTRVSSFLDWIEQIAWPDQV